MRERKVERLVRRSCLSPSPPPGPGTGGTWRRRQARRRLVRATGRGDTAAAQGLFRVWLTDPVDELWAALLQCREQEELRADALAAAVDPLCPARQRAAVGAFCLDHHLTPDEPIGRARFFAMTGQADQLQACDPDGSLLAAAYEAADGPTRTALRDVLVETGGLDAVRVVAGRDRLSSESVLDVGETTYLGRELAERGDWAQLWRLVQGARPGQAVELAALFDGHSWAPSDERGRALWARLSGWRPDDWPAAEAALWAAAQVRVPLPGASDGYRPVHEVRCGRFSDDGTQVVVAGRFLTTSSTWSERLLHYTLEDRSLVGHLTLTGEQTQAILAVRQDTALTSAVPVDQETGHGVQPYLAVRHLSERPPDGEQPSGQGGRPEGGGPADGGTLADGGTGTSLYRFGDRVIEFDPAGSITLVDGAVQEMESRAPDGVSAGTGRPGRGDRVDSIDRAVRVQLADLGIERASRRSLLAVDELLERLVVADWLTGVLVVLGPDLEVVARNDRTDTAAFIDGAVFDGPDRLLTTSGKDDVLTVWQVDDGRLRRIDMVTLRDVGWPSYTRQRPLSLPLARLMVALRASRRPAYIDLDRFELVEHRERKGFESGRATGLWRSTDGQLLALTTPSEIVVDDTRLRRVLDLLDRSLSELDPRDLAMVTAAEERLAQRGAGDDDAGRLLSLFRALLEHRLGAEVALAGGGVVAGRHEIALGSVVSTATVPSAGPDGRNGP